MRICGRGGGAPLACGTWCRGGRRSIGFARVLCVGDGLQQVLSELRCQDDAREEGASPAPVDPHRGDRPISAGDCWQHSVAVSVAAAHFQWTDAHAHIWRRCHVCFGRFELW